MKQMTRAAVKGFENHGRTSRKAEFLARMDALMPWAEFYALIEPYPKAVFRDFFRFDFGRERAPDLTTLPNFRRLLEEHDLGAVLRAIKCKLVFVTR
jgi:IS5 family transposase